MVPGSESGVCQSIFQEGLRLPPVRIYNAGVLQQELLDVILLNTRVPRERLGDLRAQFAANQVGIRGVEQVFARYGTVVPRNVESGRRCANFLSRRISAPIFSTTTGSTIAR
jgi:N-methylhydantoinase B